MKKIKCLLCGKETKEKRKFCSVDCIQIYNILRHKAKGLKKFIGNEFTIKVKSEKGEWIYKYGK